MEKQICLTECLVHLYNETKETKILHFLSFKTNVKLKTKYEIKNGHLKPFYVIQHYIYEEQTIPITITDYLKNQSISDIFKHLYYYTKNKEVLKFLLQELKTRVVLSQNQFENVYSVE